MPVDCLFLDYNSYFASCEQHLDPSLRGQPVAVTPVIADTGCCIAASYEAKAYGIKTGMRVAEARNRCPHLRLALSRPEAYVRLHHQLFAIVDSCMHIEAVHSIDEMHCPLTGKWKEVPAAIELSHQMKARLRAFSPAIRCSIGLATNQWLAKVATDMQKPDGLTVIRKSDLPDILHPLELMDLPGINRRMLARLHQHGIRTVRELCAAPRDRLRRVWGGIEGERFYFRLRGDPVPLPPTRKVVIGHSHVLSPQLRTAEGVLSVLFRLLHRASTRLRREGYYTGRMQSWVRFYDREDWADQLSFDETQDTLTLNRYLRLMIERSGQRFHQPAHAAVQLLDLVPAQSHTRSLFVRDEQRQERLNHALDACYYRYGKKGLYFGAEHVALEHLAVPMRIPFTRVPDVEHEF